VRYARRSAVVVVVVVAVVVAEAVVATSPVAVVIPEAAVVDAAVAAVAAVAAGGVAAIGRHTSAALAAVFVYAAVIEGLIRGFRPLWTPWLLGDNVVTLVSWRELTVTLFPTGAYTLEPIRASFVILGYTAVILAFAFTFVRIRDVQ